MAQLYDRPVAELMKEAAAEISYPARPGDLIAWFTERYPDVKSTTVRAHVKGLTENDTSRHHYAALARREPLFTRSRDGALMPFDASALIPHVLPGLKMQANSLWSVERSSVSASSGLARVALPVVVALKPSGRRGRP